MARARTTTNHYAGPLAISLLLHVTVLTAGMIAWPWLGKTKVVQVTPVTLLTAQQLEKLTAAEQSPTPQEAKTEEPDLAAKAEQPAPKPEPAPTPPVRYSPEMKAGISACSSASLTRCASNRFSA